MPRKGSYAPEKDPEMLAYHDAFPLCVDFISPYWDLGLRLYSLWRGKVPSQIDGTFSKIMLQTGHGMVEDRKAKLFANLFGSDHPLTLRAADPLFEPYTDQAQAWLDYKLFDENQINLRYSIIPTLTSALVMGTGYRMPCLSWEPSSPGSTKSKKPVIASRDIDFFQILPAPSGGLVNPPDPWQYDAVPWIFYVDWMTDAQIESLKNYSGFDEDAYRAMMAADRDVEGGSMESAIREKYNVVGGILYNDNRNWRNRLYDISQLKSSARRRVVHWFRRDKWVIIVQDQFKVYEGPPPYGPGIIPLVKYSIVPDFKNWCGIGTLEMSEDSIIALLMNFNYRFDHLTRTLFPTKFIRDDVFGNKTEEDFYDRPYAIHRVPQSVQRIQDAVWYDRAPEIDPQAFMEEDRLKSFLQEISGMPNYSKGMGGQGTLGNETATGIVSLIKEAQGRLSAESQNLEREGLAQEARLLLLVGDRHINDEEIVRNTADRSGFPWTSVDPEAISDRYSVITHGTSQRALEEATFQKLLALLPAFLNDPYHDPIEIRRQTHEVAQVFPDPDKLLIQPEPARQGQGQGQPGAGSMSGFKQPGGAASAQDMTQRTRGVSQRNTVEAGTGATRSVSPAPVGA